MIDIQYSITIIGGREVSRPYRIWFFAEGEHWHRQKDVFYVFCFSASSIYPLNRFLGVGKEAKRRDMPWHVSMAIHNCFDSNLHISAFETCRIVIRYLCRCVR